MTDQKFRRLLQVIRLMAKFKIEYGQKFSGHNRKQALYYLDSGREVGFRWFNE